MRSPENIHLDKIIAKSDLLAPLLLTLQTEAEKYRPEDFKNRYLILRDNQTEAIHILTHSHLNTGAINSNIQEHKDIRDQYLSDMGRAITDYILVDAGYLSFDFNHLDGHIHIMVKSGSSTLEIQSGMINEITILPYFQDWASDFENIVWEVAPAKTTQALATHLHE